MKNAEIKVGERYQIRYRAGAKPKKPSGYGYWYNYDSRPLKTGYGVCKKKAAGTKNDPHKFVLDGEKTKTVDVTSNGVKVVAKQADSLAKKVGATAEGLNEQDAAERLNNIGPVLVMLEGVGVQVKVDEATADITMTYGEALKLKSLAAKLFGATLQPLD